MHFDGLMCSYEKDSMIQVPLSPVSHGICVLLEGPFLCARNCAQLSRVQSCQHQVYSTFSKPFSDTFCVVSTKPPNPIPSGMSISLDLFLFHPETRYLHHHHHLRFYKSSCSEHCSQYCKSLRRPWSSSSSSASDSD